MVIDLALSHIREQLCPFCSRGPFVVVATHVVQAHGIDRLTLRKLLGLGPKVSICDPDYSQRVIARMAELWSPAAREAYWTPERRTTLADAFAAPREVQRARGRRGAATTSARAADRRKRLASAYHAGASVDELAAQENVTRKMIRELLHTEGVEPPRLPSRTPEMVAFRCAECDRPVCRPMRRQRARVKPWTCSASCAALQRERRRL